MYGWEQIGRPAIKILDCKRLQMDMFVFKITKTDATSYLKIGDIAGESQIDPNAVWDSDGALLQGMHVDPVIPADTAEMDALTMPRVLGRFDPEDGFEDPRFGLQEPLVGFEDQLFG
jgi:hypothetical protein